MKKIVILKIAVPIMLIIAAGAGVTFRVFGMNTTDAAIQSDTDTGESSNALVVTSETASNGDVGSLGATSISWPGEIVSYGDAEITPSRDGQIAELYIQIGDDVSVGESIGRLNPPSSSLELTALLAEKKQALISAQAQARATKELVAESIKRLKIVEVSIYRTRDSALAVAENEAVQNSNSTTGASKELESLIINRTTNINASSAELLQAEAILPIKFNAVRAAATALSQRFEGAREYEIRNSSRVYKAALKTLVSSLSNPSYVPEVEANAYIQAALKLVSKTESSDEVPASALSNLRNIIFEDQQIFIEALNDYVVAQNDIIVKRAKLDKMSAGIDRDIIGAESNVRINDAFLQTSESMKANQIAQADEEYAKEKASLDVKKAELSRQLTLANAEVEAAEAAYQLVETGTGSQILASSSGVVSSIYKKVGDYVSIAEPIVATSSPNRNEKFVRFRVPLDMKLPEKNEEVIITRPGFPMDPKRAKIIGIGISLDENGSFQADAKFIEEVEWPANLSVRVVYQDVSNFILIPFSSVWWDDKEVSHIWLVSGEGRIQSQEVVLGRALGDRIEVVQGLLEGEKFVSIAAPTMTEGILVSETGNTKTKSSENPAAQPDTEGHAGHEGH